MFDCLSEQLRCKRGYQELYNCVNERKNFEVAISCSELSFMEKEEQSTKGKRKEGCLDYSIRSEAIYLSSDKCKVRIDGTRNYISVQLRQNQISKRTKQRMEVS